MPIRSPIYLLALAAGLLTLLPAVGAQDPPRDPLPDPPAAQALEADPPPAPDTGLEDATRDIEQLVSNAVDTAAVEFESGNDPSERPDFAGKRRVGDLVLQGGKAVVGTNEVADDVVVIGGDADIAGDVSGDLVVVRGAAKITGHVWGNHVVVLGSSDINGLVDGDLVLVLTEGRLGPQARVSGETVVVGRPAEIAPGAVLTDSVHQFAPGEMIERVVPRPFKPFVKGAGDYFADGGLWLRPFPPGVGWVWVAALVFLALRVLLAAALPGATLATMNVVREQPFRAFLTGLLVLVLLPFVSLLLSLTAIGVFFIPLLVLVLFAFSVFGRNAVYGVIGAAIGRRTGQAAWEAPALAVLVGTLLFYASYMVWVLGNIVFWLVLPLALGAVTLGVAQGFRRERAVVGLLPGGGPALPPGVPAPSEAAAPASTSVPASSLALGAIGTPVPGIAGPAVEATPPVPPRLTPDTATLLSSARVGFWPRLAAAALDLLVVGLINAITFRDGRAFVLLLAIYHIGFWMWRGTTPGGIVLGLRLVRLDGRPLDWQTAVVRALASVLSLLPLGLGFLWASWDAENQSWHDRIAGTCIVKLNRRTSLV